MSSTSSAAIADASVPTGISVIDQIERALERDEPVFLPPDGSAPEFGKEAERSLYIRRLEDVVAEQRDTIQILTRDKTALTALLNTPLFNDFTEAVKREAAHQVQRWGDAHDRSKSAENWFWLVGYLAGKALRSAIKGDRQKALHHTISSAAALMQWHAAILTDMSGDGVGQDEDLKVKEGAS